MDDSVDPGIVTEYQRLLALEQDRRRKRDTLEALLPTIADALDVRVVFPRMSAQIQDVIPHVTVALALLTPDRGGVRIHVASNYDVGDLPEYRFTTEGEAIRSSWRAFITYSTVVEEGVLRVRTTPQDAEPEFVDLRPGPVWTRIVTRFGIRAVLRVPVRVKVISRFSLVRAYRADDCWRWPRIRPQSAAAACASRPMRRRVWSWRSSHRNRRGLSSEAV